jgi:hypothetical protein
MSKTKRTDGAAHKKAPDAGKAASPSTGGSSLVLPFVFAAIAIGIQQLHERGHLDHLLTAKPAASKPFATFNEFYPFYLSQHADQDTKRMHFVGTGIFVAVRCL